MTSTHTVPTLFVADRRDVDAVHEALSRAGFDVQGDPKPVVGPLPSGYYDFTREVRDAQAMANDPTTTFVIDLGWSEDDEWFDVDLLAAVDADAAVYYVCPSDAAEVQNV